ncbi:MAG: hypothetical protein UT32_C0026G0002 [Parcubacteria group bacterium GW2011_GWC2_39_14]|nr:MAG: hypothetical protein UT32_C0026G0002 [Parcubacteria group bacterium GW2011_GWC2_39_14]KKR53424.1 MAG: hypothetical protein UT91_C0027G0002 [Parcubacteria group bacterium GW2011_GWA2_40_23]
MRRLPRGIKPRDGIKILKQVHLDAPLHAIGTKLCKVKPGNQKNHVNHGKKNSRTQNALSTGKNLTNDDRVAFRGDGDDDHLTDGTLFDLVHDVATLDRQLVVRTAAGDILGPARHVQVDRFAIVEDLREADEIRDLVTITEDASGIVHFRSAVDVARAKSNRINAGHDIELGQDQRRTVHLHGILQRYEVEPTCATRTTCGSTELFALHTNADTEVILSRHRQGRSPLLVLSIQFLE